MSDILGRQRTALQIAAYYDASYPPGILEGGPGTPDPHISNLIPDSGDINDPIIQQRILGRGFVMDSEVEIDGAAQTTTWYSDTELQIDWSPALPAGQKEFTVRNPDAKESNSVFFDATAPAVEEAAPPPADTTPPPDNPPAA